MYRCEATSLSGFIQQLAVNYVSRGYFFYVKGEIPANKDPARTDEKLIRQYGIGMSKWAKARQRRRGEASIQYLRLGRVFVILATHGRSHFFDDEAASVRDVRRCPITLFGYSVGYQEGEGGGHVSVRIERRLYKQLKEGLLNLATARCVERLLSNFASFGFELFAPVRNQLFSVLRAVNRKRRASGFEPVTPGAIWRRATTPIFK